VLKETYETMLVILLGIFILRWGEPSDGYRPVTSRPFELSSNRRNLCCRIVLRQLILTDDDPNVIHPAPLERSQRRPELADNHSDDGLRPAIRVVQLRCIRAGQIEELGD